MKPAIPTYNDLTAAQKVALIDLVANKTLNRATLGWYGGGESGSVHAHGTMLALQRRGLADINPIGCCMGSAKPTRAARKIIIAEFGKTPPLVAVTKAKSKIKRRVKR